MAAASPYVVRVAGDSTEERGYDSYMDARRAFNDFKWKLKAAKLRKEALIASSRLLLQLKKVNKKHDALAMIQKERSGDDRLKMLLHATILASGDQDVKLRWAGQSEEV